ncbi:hypothetical protein KFK09_012473 [Dendrobium nobile]|uniref:Uncharacterized protein n=1 Tax=Dendrobium nobile TaxID=94219 RepID=A0A8T3BHT7_DENNO|nr:hypothetical protein KFK09_012473 [Dendrobium nobile]
MMEMGGIREVIKRCLNGDEVAIREGSNKGEVAGHMERERERLEFQLSGDHNLNFSFNKNLKLNFSFLKRRSFLN